MYAIQIWKTIKRDVVEMGLYAKKGSQQRYFMYHNRLQHSSTIQVLLRRKQHKQIKITGKINQKVLGGEISLADKDSEKRTRTYVTDTLRELGWNIKKPQNGGNLLQEGECQKYDDRIKDSLKSASKTGKGEGLLDFLLVNNEKLLCAIIETKPDKADIEDAVKDGKHYASFLNSEFNIRILIAVAGNEENGIVVKNYFLIETKWEIITAHGQPLTQILSYEQLETVLKNNKPTLDIRIPPLEYLYKRADKINSILHKHKIEESARAKVIASIILAMYQGEFSLKESLVIDDINTRVKEGLKECKDPDKIYSMMALNKHDKSLAKAIPLIVYELKKVNISSLMKSGYDVLGTFYEVFLKYGGDNRQLGIVFTPRYITEFATNLIDLTPTDLVYDPTCGSAGFLVSAFNKFKELVNNRKADVKRMGDTQIFGNDTSPSVYPLGVVNMIFRDDGKNNIVFQDCFEFPENKQFTKVLMNPPFKTEKQDPPESDYINHALKCLCIGGRLISVVPISVLCDPDNKKWREELISEHTIEAVISLHPETFTAAGIITALITIKAHIPQNKQKIFFCKMSDDGYVLKKGVRLKVSDGQFAKVKTSFVSKTEEYEFSCYSELKTFQSVYEMEKKKLVVKGK